MKKKLVDQAGPKSQLEVCAIFEDMLSKTCSNFLSRLSALIVLYTDSIDKKCILNEKNLLSRLGQSRS